MELEMAQQGKSVSRPNRSKVLLDNQTKFATMETVGKEVSA